MADNILVVGSHPDDIELGCGGTIVKHLALGDRVFTLVMTNGERGGHPFRTKDECFNSLLSLGVPKENILFGNFPDGFLTADCNTVSFIEDYIKKYRISKIYTHDPNDRHQDHRNCSMAVSSAARKVPSILLYQGPSTNVHFEPHYFIELEKAHLNKKISALGNYKSQLKKGIVDLRWIKHLAGSNGNLCNSRYAEAFAINHIFEDGKNV